MVLSVVITAPPTKVSSKINYIVWQDTLACLFSETYGAHATCVKFKALGFLWLGMISPSSQGHDRGYNYQQK
jgi:hypothetical protein